jgi:hypothetical protein
MFYFQAELIAKQKQQEIEMKAKDAWKFHKGYEEQSPIVNKVTQASTPNVHSCCCCPV